MGKFKKYLAILAVGSVIGLISWGDLRQASLSTDITSNISSPSSPGLQAVINIRR